MLQAADSGRDGDGKALDLDQRRRFAELMGRKAVKPDRTHEPAAKSVAPIQVATFEIR